MCFPWFRFSFRSVLARPGLLEQEVDDCVFARVVWEDSGEGAFRDIGKSEVGMMVHGIDTD